MKNMIDSECCHVDIEKKEVPNLIPVKQVIWAVNCGNVQKSYTNPHGILYKKDTGYSPNSQNVKYNSLNCGGIKNSNDDEIHLYERHGSTSFSYKIPINIQREYTLIL